MTSIEFEKSFSYLGDEDSVRNKGKLTDFKVRTSGMWGMEPGKLKDYIEAPITNTMSWPPQAAEVKKDLRKYLMKKGINNKYFLVP